MRYLVLAIIMAAGVSLIGIAGASAAPANGQAIGQARRSCEQYHRRERRMRARLASWAARRLPPQQVVRSFD